MKAFVAAALVAIVAVPLFAQVAALGDGGPSRSRDTAPTGPVPRLPDGTMDLSGVWLGGGSVQDLERQGNVPKGAIQLLPEAKKLMDSRQSKDDPQANCLPSGVPRVNPYPWRMLQYPTHTKATHIFIVFEGNIHSYRQIFMDGRKHPADLDPTWYGHSIGWWEGDTLVIDTVGFNDKFWFDFRGLPHTEQLHTIERWTRKDLGHMVNEITIDDPGAYAKPFKATFTATLMPPGDELLEYICQENNIDPPHLQGPASPDPPGFQGTRREQQ